MKAETIIESIVSFIIIAITIGVFSLGINITYRGDSTRNVMLANSIADSICAVRVNAETYSDKEFFIPPFRIEETYSTVNNNSIYRGDIKLFIKQHLVHEKAFVFEPVE